MCAFGYGRASVPALFCAVLLADGFWLLAIGFPFVMLNLVNYVQFANARHSPSKLGSALAKPQISASVRGEGQVKARAVFPCPR